MPDPVVATPQSAEARLAALTERAEAAEKVQGELLAITGKATAADALAHVASLMNSAASALAALSVDELRFAEALGLDPIKVAQYKTTKQ
jgi:hypothetical protein